MDAELRHLVTMANDIARNLAAYDDAPVRVADHMRRFWAPAMRQRLVAHADSGGDELVETALLGVRQLTEKTAAS
ncbi:formate dehydrogenase subunit delta [Marinihelvus fidelis]|uniref:Formate dehydrogenase subunit delta n=1 Tax=Marinihelvus fidelis TaxID=2613842 RepID=A0A5N0TCW0_9GAMM|nr:formate dehydrogenase subunit delta [Marinihelvus fidelis]KAA9132518.1 formate dehydrogenase subunit delta [Marinihelvus fidelis]